jgi:Zn-finger protein
MALNQGQGMTFPRLGQPMDINQQHAETVCYNCQSKGHTVHNCHNPHVPHQQVQQMEEVLAQGARIKEVKEMTKEEKEKKADELRAQLKALGF